MSKTKNKPSKKLDVAIEADALQAFEYGMAEEINCWMDEFAEPLLFVCKKVVDGEVVFPLNFKSKECKALVKKLTQEYYGNDNNGYDEPIRLVLLAIDNLASGDTGVIHEQLTVYIEEEPEPWSGLTLDGIAKLFLGEYVKSAKALANASMKLWYSNAVLPYPHEKKKK